MTEEHGSIGHAHPNALTSPDNNSLRAESPLIGLIKVTFVVLDECDIYIGSLIFYGDSLLVLLGLVGIV